MFTEVLLTIVQMRKLPRCPSVGDRMKKKWYNGTSLGVKMNEILPFVTTWMSLEDILLSEICQTEKEIHHMIAVICGI